MTKPPIFPVPNHQPPPQVYMGLLTKIKNCEKIRMSDTKEEGLIYITNLE